MKIAHVVLKTLPFGGGVEKYIEEIGPRLVQKGHEIVVYTMRHYGNPPVNYKGMRLKAVPALATKTGEKITSASWATLDACLKEKPDVIHFHSFTQQTTFFPKWFGIPVLVQGHGLEWKRSRWSPAGKAFLKMSEWIMVHSADRLTVVSQVQQAYLKEKYGKESAYIPTGINPPRRVEPSEITRLWGLKGRDYFLSAGRLVPEKGIHTLIEAYQGLGATGLRLVIAGDAGHEKKYFRRLQDLSRGNPNILFIGYVTGQSYAELMSNAYTFVLPSELEGLPTVLLEARSYGNCCVASDIAENREAMGGQGRTFPVGRAADLKDLLRGLAADPQEASRLRTLASEGLLDSFHWDKIAEQFHHLYGQMRKAKGQGT